MDQKEDFSWCWNSGARELLSVGEALAARVRCSRCGRLLKVRVPAQKFDGSSARHTEATLPRHKNRRKSD
jgi:hypothetical protein